MDNPKFAIFIGKKGQYYFHLKAANGEIILQSEGYADKGGAKNGIESVKENAPLDERYERKTSEDNKPYFVLKAANGEPIGKSEMYESSQGCDNGIDAVKKTAPDAPTDDQT